MRNICEEEFLTDGRLWSLFGQNHPANDIGNLCEGKEHEAKN